MADFMYLFRSNPEAWKSMSPEQMQQTFKKWMEWKDGIEKNGNLKLTGERLSENGKVVKGKSKTITDGPYVEVKDFIQGYMVVSAESIEQAAEFAKGCPILESDGSVEIRPFMQM
ncbi:MAG: YciI family protein [Thermodesulfobacteriota bacterium]|mgnify:FL=1